ncbi:hypothetical protein ACHAWU_007889 [Discostella pseudostelligera]|uniref:Uncharacterized protein n=1 Tax=Discostella pseudostelligera TaxID=259834 RepID=A0ABD3MD50_9STRA
MKTAEHKSKRMMPKDASSLLPDASGKSVGVENKSEDWTRFGKRQILSVGKKNEALHYNYEDDELAAGDGYHSSSDEEDGRTAAGREKKKKSLTLVSNKNNQSAPPANDDIALTSMHGSTSQPTAKKHKKRKKEKKGNSMDNNTEMELAASGTTTDQTNLAKIDANIGDDALIAANEVPQNEDTSNKKKRKKIRSRQKNIRKDHRTQNDKPSHLIVGSDAYCGRPMTKETRQKLGIQPTAKKSARTRVNNDAFDSGEWVGDNKPDDNTEDVTADAKPKMKEGGNASTLTKIGDCIVNDDAKVDVGHDDVLPSSNDITIKSTKKQKRKFKNLLV